MLKRISTIFVLGILLHFTNVASAETLISDSNQSYTAYTRYSFQITEEAQLITIFSSEVVKDALQLINSQYNLRHGLDSRDSIVSAYKRLLSRGLIGANKSDVRRLLVKKPRFVVDRSDYNMEAYEHYPSLTICVIYKNDIVVEVSQYL